MTQGTRRRALSHALVASTVLVGFSALVPSADAAPPSDPTPLLTYAASQKFPPEDTTRIRAFNQRQLDRIQFELKKDPPPETNCAQTLGAKRFSAQLDDLGGVYTNMGDDVRAAEAYSKAIECDPRAEFLHAQLASALIDLRRYAEARAEIERELTLGRGTFALHNLMTQIDFIDHLWTEAALNARLAVTEAPDDEQATYWQCLLWLAQQHNGVQQPSLANRHVPQTWPGPILASLQGKITENELVDAIESEDDRNRRREILTEALFYTGEQRLAARHVPEATRYLEATVNQRVLYFIEHHLAVAELEKLRHTDSTP